LSQSAICCIAAPSPALLHRQHAEFILSAAGLKGALWQGLMFLPSLLVIAEEAIE